MFPLNEKGLNNWPWRAMPFERRLLLSILWTGIPGITLAFLLLWTSTYSLSHKLEITVFALFLWWSSCLSAKDLVIRSLRRISNLITALKEENVTTRAYHAVPGDALGDIVLEVNQISRALEVERLRTIDSLELLRHVTSAAGAGILVVSLDGRLRMVNPTAAKLLGSEEEDLLRKTARELNIEELVSGAQSKNSSHIFPNDEGRWIIRRTSFRQKGVPHQLVVITEASEALRAEERLAWQRIIRVIGHEINNSLAPIKSLARTLARIVANTKLPTQIQNDLDRGLMVIGDRAESLNSFLQQFAELAKLPSPARSVVNLRLLLESIIRLKPSFRVTILPSPEARIHVDSHQFERVLINLITNAIEAVSAAAKTEFSDVVTIAWQVVREDLLLWVSDRGVGAPDEANLFVPFYTTKERGSGIGLVLSRQIIEGHGGTLILQNRKDTTGCIAQITIPRCVMTADPTRHLENVRIRNKSVPPRTPRS
jgi:two-component system, NtrC family, nitrogen regulation sensor histidine kinase NtrY